MGGAAPPWTFPPRTSHVILPPNSRAALSGLALYTALYPRQRAALTVARIAILSGGGRLFRASRPQPVPDPSSWARWCRDVAEPLVGEVSYTALLTPGQDRTCALLMDHCGMPVGFVKLRPRHEVDGVEAAVVARLHDPVTTSFRAPRVLAESSFEDRHARLTEALPRGLHRRPPQRPRALAALVDELQTRLSEQPRPTGAPSSWRPCHGDLTPRNVRLASDGRWWVYDWEYAGWAPRLADELRYWIADSCFQRSPNARHVAGRVVRLLRARGKDDEIAEALAWPCFNLPVEQAVRHEVSRLITSGCTGTICLSSPRNGARPLA